MAIGTPYTVVAQGAVSTATANSDTITQTADVPAGDSLFIMASVRLNVSTLLNSITNSNSYSVSPDIYAATTGVQNGDMWIIRIYASVLLSGTGGTATSWTLNYSQSPTRHQLCAFGVSGVADAVADANHIGRANAGSGQGTVATAGTTPAAGDLAIACYNHVGASASGMTATPTTNFTEFADGPSNAATPFLHQYVEWDILGSGGTVTSAPTFSGTTGGWLGEIVVFQPAAATGAPPRPMIQRAWAL